MIVGECPYCDQPWFQEMPPASVPLPVIGRVACEVCGKESWMLFSRVEPEAIPLEDWKPGDPWPGKPDLKIDPRPRPSPSS